ncbi:MAG: hypothetical protein NVSMB64_18680 [Candidatus Velthaea sp.]
MKRFLATLTALCCLALPLCAYAATTPAMMNAMPACKSGDPVVWVNTHTKVFHVQGDSFYGKTKSGKYACKSDALAMGAHMSGSKMKKGAMSGSAMDASDSMAPDTMSTAMPGKMKHKKKRGAMTMPDASPTP